METVDYREVVRNMGYSKRLGQNFLMNAEIAKGEAEYARGRDALEIGPGLGILTSKLLKVAKSVTAVEKDRRMYEFLADNFKSKKLRLIHADFLEVKDSQIGKIDIVVSNIPYGISSRVVMWLSERDIPAVLCMQKEFVDRMLAQPGTREYSKLSVVSALQFRLTKIFDVTPNNFYPEPEVTSTVVYLKPTGKGIPANVSEIIGAIMSHKKKRVKNALLDCASQLGMDRSIVASLVEKFNSSEARPFQMEPSAILEVAESIIKAGRD